MGEQVTERGGTIFMGLELVSSRTLLPACKTCGGAHAESKNIREPAWVCTCDTPPARSWTEWGPAIATGIGGWFGTLFLAIGRRLYRFAHKEL